jgi:lipopolysaccharide/colanic/teichoic acid biosynthesis glycosyltransferase
MSANIERTLIAETEYLPAMRSKRDSRILAYLLLAVLDSACIIASGAAASLIRFGGLGHPLWLNFAAVALPVYLIIAINSSAYSLQALKSRSASTISALQSYVFTIGSLLLIAYFLKAEHVSRIFVLVSAILAMGGLGIVRFAAFNFIRRVMKDRFTAEVVIVDGVDYPAVRGPQIIDAALIDLAPDPRDPAMVQKLATMLKGADRVVIACRPEARPSWAMLLKGAGLHGEVMAADIDALGALSFGRMAGQTTLVVATGPLDLRNQMVKRLFDLVLTIPALVLLAPVLLLTAIAIKIDSKGPVLFRQKRIGRGNALFEIYKFRSMRVEATDETGTRSADPQDERLTRVGRFIRRSSLDELPQLFNVLMGSMSIVGPRPHALGSLAGQQLFWEVDERYWHRHALKPGITGLAQVRGYRGATRRQDDLTRRLQADLEYMSGWTIWRDIAIVIATARVIFHRNAY